MNWLQRMFAVLAAWWRALSAPRRVAYASAAVLLGAGVVASGAPIEVMVGLWIAANGAFLVRLAVWGLLHPAAVVRARDAILGWALAVAVSLTLLLHSGFAQLLAQISEVWIPNGLLFFAAVVGLLPLLFVLGLVTGMLGAALGDFLARRTPHVEALARVGVSGFWLTLLLVFVATNALVRFEAPMPARLAVAGGVPLLSLWLAPLARHLQTEQMSALLHGWMMRWLMVRLPSSRGSKLVDLRIVTFSLAGFLAAALLSWSGLLGFLEPSVLLWMTRQQNGAVHLPWLRAAAPSMPDTLVLLTWDNPAAFRAWEQSSEPAVQTELLRRLSEWGAAQIVVPVANLTTNLDAAPDPAQASLAPGLESHAQDQVVDTKLPGLPALPNTEARRRWERSVLDLPALFEAARASGRAIIALPARELAHVLDHTAWPPDSPGWRTVAAGLPVGTDRLPPFRVSLLPAVPLAWPEDAPPPVPWLVLQALSGAPKKPLELRPSARELVIGDKRLPLLAPGVLLVDFRPAWPDEDFPRLPISAVLYDHKVPVRDPQGVQTWIPAHEFFKDRIVFVESAHPRRRATPVGELTRMETLVYATATVLGDGGLRRANPLVLGCWALFWSIVVGWTSARRGLLGGIWRLAGAALAILLLTASEFLQGTWLDPVFPLFAAGGSLLLVTQLSFALERRARDQTRALLQRFVAPEVVEELLDDPDHKLGLGGRRERVVVLFADVRGFSRFAEQNSPEEVVKAVNAYLHVMTDALHHYGGLLDKYTGDGLMALFRFAHDETEPVSRAVSAALAMRDAVLALSVDRDAGGARSLQVGIALHVGEAVVGLVGNPVRQINYTALGHAVVIAARLQGLALGGEVVVSQDVKAAVETRFELEAREPVQVKGLSQPVLCYAVKREFKMPAQASGVAHFQ